MAADPMEVEALVFDVFGTVVDWRSSIIREGRALGERLGIEADWEAFADAWEFSINYYSIMHDIVFSSSDETQS